jgi:hypothetical protein
MVRKGFVTLILLGSALVLNSQAQQPVAVQRLGITATTLLPAAWFVVKGSPAQKAGIRANDLVLAFDDQPVATTDDVKRIAASAAPGEHKLTALRDGKTRQFTLDLGAAGPDRLGLILLRGVGVDSIERGAPAGQFGLHTGDRITSVRIDGVMHLTPTVEDLANIIAAIPASQPFELTYAHGDSATAHAGQLQSQPTADAAVLSQAPAVPSRAGQVARGEGATGGAAQNPRGDAFSRGETQGDYVVPGRQAQTRPVPGGRGAAAAGEPVRGAAPQDPAGGRMASRLQAMRQRGAGADSGGNAQRNATLDQLMVPISYKPSLSIATRMAEINVLKYAFVDQNTGDVVFVGSYDPTYATGPIPYNALLADAMGSPYPRFTLEFPGSGGQSPLGRIRSTLDQEFARIASDPNYGVQWLGRLILPVLKGDSSDPDQQAALNARLQVLGITPASYRAYMTWQLGGFKDMQAYNGGAADFLPRVMELSGLSRKGGAEITAYRVYATMANRESLDEWCRIAGYTDLLARIDQQVRNGGNRSAGTAELLPALYGSMLRGLGLSESEVSRIQSDYARQGGNEGVLVTPLEQRYQAVFQQFLIDKLVNGMSFTGATLSGQYNFPTIMSALNTYGARRDSPVMNVFFQADYILKFMTASPRPGERIPQHQTSQQYLGDAENRAGRSAGKTPASGVIRYWLYPQNVTLDPLAGNSGVRFRDASVRVGVEMLDSVGGDAAGLQFYKTTLDEYSSHLTSLYEQYARLYPMLHTLRETEKVVALARWAQKNGVRVRVQADSAPPATLPDAAPGFWGMTYVVRPTGSTDTIVTWAQGGVDFGQSTGDAWMQAGPADRQVTNDALRSLAASTALAEKAAAAAGGGDLESARDLAERSAQAMSGNIDFTNLPPVPMPSGPVVDPAALASVSQASIVAVEMNTQGLQQAKQGLAEAASLQATDPARAAQIHQQNLELQQHSLQDLNRLQTMLQEYRGTGSNGYQVAIDLRGLDPNKPLTVGSMGQAAPNPAPAAPTPATAAPTPAADPCPQGLEAVLPTRQQVLTELTSRRLELENLRNTLVRLNKNIQLDQKQYADWQAEAEDAVQRLTERKQDLYRDAGFGLMTYGIDKWMLYDKVIFDKLAPADRVRVKQKVEILKGAKDAKEFARWALSNKKDWEMIEGGVRLFLEELPLGEEYQAVVKGTEAIIDNIYDAADFQVTWENVNRLNHSSDQYLEVVKQNGERMKALVTRIRDLEVQLRQAPALPPHSSPCRTTERGQAQR